MFVNKFLIGNQCKIYENASGTFDKPCTSLKWQFGSNKSSIENAKSPSNEGDCSDRGQWNRDY